MFHRFHVQIHGFKFTVHAIDLFYTSPVVIALGGQKQCYSVPVCELGTCIYVRKKNYVTKHMYV